MEEHLIDDELNATPKDVILGIMRWWEKKRLIFNLIMVSIIIIVVSIYLSRRPDSYSYVFNVSFFVQSFFYFIFINICYCAGWGIQLLAYYYFKIQYDTKALDFVLFIIGSLFTAFVTYMGYMEYLMYRNPF